MRRLLMAVTFLAAGMLMQRWSGARRTDRRRVRREDVPRWEGEGGASVDPAGLRGTNSPQGIPVC